MEKELIEHNFDVEYRSKGFIEHDLKICKSDKYLFGAILNKNWVLWYFRLPSFADDDLMARQIKNQFSEVVPNKIGELKLRIRNSDESRALVNWLVNNY